jgi:[ribosomal protein S18]-alanine N-acetyltransferase
MKRHIRGRSRNRSAGPPRRRVASGLIERRHLALRSDMQSSCRFAAKGDFRTVHLKHPGVASGRAGAGHDASAGQETEFHEAARVFSREVEVFYNGGVAPAQIDEGLAGRGERIVIDIELQYDSSMAASEMVVKPGAPNGVSRRLSTILPRLNANKFNMLTPIRRCVVRRTLAGDLDRILEIENACFGIDAYDRNTFAGYMRRGGELFLVARRGRVICGYTLACVSGERAEIVSVAVHPDARRLGVARALMKNLLGRLAQHPVARVALMVRISNPEAQGLYRGYGFHTVRRVRAYYDDGEDGWLMHLPMGRKRRDASPVKRKQAEVASKPS